MTSDTKSSEEIEQEIERERAGLRESIDDLQDRFSMDGVMQRAGDQLREHGGEFGRSVAQAARDNPVALALTGIGVAWLMFGSNREPDRYSDRYTAPRGPRPDARSAGALSHDVPDYAERRGAAYSGPKTAARTASGTAPDTAPKMAARRQAQSGWARDWDHDELGHSQSHAPSGSSAGASAAGASGPGAGAAVRGAAGSARDAVSSGASSARETASGAARSVRDTAGNVWSSASQRTDALRRRLSEGTEHLSEEARERIGAARARAIDARDEAARRLSRGTDQAADFYDEHPLVVGALAFAIGAAIAGALPRTRMEDDYIGAYSDELYDEAERIYAEEVQKAQKVVKAGVDEARNVASEFKADADDAAPGEQSATDAAADKASSAADRIAGAARDEADKEGLGNRTKDA